MENLWNSETESSPTTQQEEFTRVFALSLPETVTEIGWDFYFNTMQDNVIPISSDDMLYKHAYQIILKNLESKEVPVPPHLRSFIEYKNSLDWKLHYPNFYYEDCLVAQRLNIDPNVFTSTSQIADCINTVSRRYDSQDVEAIERILSKQYYWLFETEKQEKARKKQITSGNYYGADHLHTVNSPQNHLNSAREFLLGGHRDTEELLVPYCYNDPEDSLEAEFIDVTKIYLHDQRLKIIDKEKKILVDLSVKEFEKSLHDFSLIHHQYYLPENASQRSEFYNAIFQYLSDNSLDITEEKIEESKSYISFKNGIYDKRENRITDKDVVFAASYIDCNYIESTDRVTPNYTTGIEALHNMDTEKARFIEEILYCILTNQYTNKIIWFVDKNGNFFETIKNVYKKINPSDRVSAVGLDLLKKDNIAALLSNKLVVFADTDVEKTDWDLMIKTIKGIEITTVKHNKEVNYTNQTLITARTADEPNVPDEIVQYCCFITVDESLNNIKVTAEETEGIVSRLIDTVEFDLTKYTLGKISSAPKSVLNNPIDIFLASDKLAIEKNQCATPTDLYELYKQEIPDTSLSNVTFSKNLTEKGFERKDKVNVLIKDISGKETPDRARVFFGIGIKDGNIRLDMERMKI